MKLSQKVGLDEIDVADKRILVRVDYNVPLDEHGNVASNTRIAATLSTIRYLIERGARTIVLISHLGRPDGQPDPSLSLRPVAIELERLLGQRVSFLPDCVGKDIVDACQSGTSTVYLLENLRFHAEEEGKATPKHGPPVTASKEAVARFREDLSRLGDIYVNDAFGTLHRAHSSIVGVDMALRVAGFLLKKELTFFSQVLEGPDRIDVAILGGAKVTDKIPLIRNMLKRVRHLVIGGAMPFTFLKAMHDIPIGNSLYDEKGAETVPAILEEARAQGVTVHLPVDFVIGDALSQDARSALVDDGQGIPDGWMGLDIGPKTAAKFTQIIQQGRLILWNGPVGVFELDKFSAGTKAVLDALVYATAHHGATTVVGGGDSAAAVSKWNAEARLSHVSTGGGASLELLEGRELPGIQSLSDKC